MLCKLLSCVRFCATPWTVAHQAPVSMEFSRQEYRSGLPCSPPGDLPHPGIETASLKSPALAGRFFTTRATWEARNVHRAADDSNLDPALSTRALSLHF